MTDEGGYLRRQFKTAGLLTDLHFTDQNASEIGYARFLYAVRR